MENSRCVRLGGVLRDAGITVCVCVCVCVSVPMRETKTESERGVRVFEKYVRECFRAFSKVCFQVIPIFFYDLFKRWL